MHSLIVSFCYAFNYYDGSNESIMFFLTEFGCIFIEQNKRIGAKYFEDL